MTINLTNKDNERVSLTNAVVLSTTEKSDIVEIAMANDEYSLSQWIYLVSTRSVTSVVFNDNGRATVRIDGATITSLWGE